MTRLSSSQVRKDFAEALNRVAYKGERIILRRRGKDVAALVSMEDLSLLRELEDRLDLDEVRAALAEPAGKVPWEKIKADLGL